MKEILLELAECDYSDLPLHKKRMFWCIVEHFLHQDNEKFREIWFRVSKWATEDDGRVKIIDQSSNGQPNDPIQ